MLTINEILKIVRDEYETSPFKGLCKVASASKKLTENDVARFKDFIFFTTSELKKCYTIEDKEVEREFGQYIWRLEDRNSRLDWLNDNIC